jgi:hypothetical protein
MTSRSPKATGDVPAVTVGSASSVGSSRFSLGLSHAFGKKRNDFAVGGLPAEVPVIPCVAGASQREQRAQEAGL